MALQRNRPWHWLVALIVLAGVSNAQEYGTASSSLRAYTVHAAALSGDSTMLFDVAPHYFITGIAVIVDSTWKASDSLKIGTSGFSSMRPGNLFAYDSAWFNTRHGKTWLFREAWQPAKTPIYLYHDGLGADRSGSVKIYVWTQSVEGDSATKFEPMGFWNDLIGTASSLRLDPTVAYPEFNYTSIGYMFRDAQSDTLYAIFQMDHGVVNGTTLHPHAHWLQTDTGKVVWKIRYKITNPGGTESAWADTSGYSPEFTYVSGNKMQITEVATLPGLIGGEFPITLSAIIEVKLVRLGTHPQDTYPHSALLKAFDIHYLRNGIKTGTYNEYGDE